MSKTTLFSSVTFLKSAVSLEDLPRDTGMEIAFVGRSNVGKSSVLNVLTGLSIAKVSNTPGRTQAINVFTLSPTKRLIDLPGYGYAKVPKAMRDHWDILMQDYFSARESLKGILLIMDARHPFKKDDIIMLEWAKASKLPVHILLNKTDKLKQQELQSMIKTITLQYADFLTPPFSYQIFSAMKKTGLPELQNVLKTWGMV
jgi:GTP-binding protein